MDETTGKPVLCTNAAGYGTGRKDERVWRAGEIDSEGAEGVYCGGNTVKCIDSIMRLERIMEKMNTIPRMCEDINRWHIENPILQAKDYMASSSLAQAESILTKDAFALARKQNDIYRDIYMDIKENINLGLTAVTQIEKTQMSLKSALKTMEKYEGFYQKLVEGRNLGLRIQIANEPFGIIEDITRNKFGLGMKSITKMDALSQAAISVAENLTAIESITKVLDQYQNSMDQILASIQQVPIYKLDTIYQMGMDLDIGDVSILEDGALSYQGVTYEQCEVPQEIVRQVQELKQEPISLKQHVEGLRQKYWLLILVVSIYMYVPAFADATKYYVDECITLAKIVFNLPQMCYTIKEKSYLRAEANAKSKILATLVYDTELEILEDIPRWYKVKYIDEIGTETEGWIPKKSVEE